MEEQIMHNAAAPEIQPPAPKPAGKKTGLLLAILIPLVLVLVAGGIFGGILISRNNQYQKALEYLDDDEIEEAIEIHKKLGDYKDLEAEICDAAESECKKLLKKNNYKKIPALYELVAEYPEALEAMDKRAEKHLEDLLENEDYEQLVVMRREYTQREALHEQILEALEEAAEDLWDYSRNDTLNLYTMLLEEDICLEGVENNVLSLMDSYIAEAWYHDALGYYSYIAHSDRCVKHVQQSLLAQVQTAMAANDQWSVEYLLEAMTLYTLDGEPIQQAVYDYACQQMELENYDEAYDYFSMLGEYKDSADKRYELEILNSIATLERYVENGWYYDAKYLVDSFTGEAYERLLAAYLAHCGDLTYIADLEAALLARLKLADEDGASYTQLLETEYAYLEKYQSMPFYDSRLEELADSYYEALGDQHRALTYYVDYEYYDYYEFYYYWDLAACDRYAVLDLLNAEYGFGGEDAQLQSLLGIAEGRRQYVEGWYAAHNCLAYYLWNNVPYYENGTYYLDVYNYTDYTFDIAVYQDYYTWDDEWLHSFECKIVSMEPGEMVKVQIDYPVDEDVDHWYIDWEIYNIYYQGKLLG